MNKTRKVQKPLAQFFGIALGVTLESFAVYLLISGLLWGLFGYLFFGVALTVASACSFKLVLDFPAFSIYSLVHTLPMNLLFWFVARSLWAPTSDPVGGNGVNSAIVLLLLAVWCAVLGPLSLASFWCESRGRIWYVVLGGLFVPALTLLALFVTGVLS